MPLDQGPLDTPLGTQSESGWQRGSMRHRLLLVLAIAFSYIVMLAMVWGWMLDAMPADSCCAP